MRLTEREREREREGERERERERGRKGGRGREGKRKTGQVRDRQAYKQTDRQTGVNKKT